MLVSVYHIKLKLIEKTHFWRENVVIVSAKLQWASFSNITKSVNH